MGEYKKCMQGIYYEACQKQCIENAHELIVGEYLPDIWRTPVIRGFVWSKSPQSDRHWHDLYAKNRTVTQDDVDVLMEFYQLSPLREVTKEDIV